MTREKEEGKRNEDEEDEGDERRRRGRRRRRRRRRKSRMMRRRRTRSRRRGEEWRMMMRGSRRMRRKRMRMIRRGRMDDKEEDKIQVPQVLFRPPTPFLLTPRMRAPPFSGAAVMPDGTTRFLSLRDEMFKDKYVVLIFFHANFTYVCPTEIIAYSDRVQDFVEIGCKICESMNSY